MVAKCTAVHSLDNVHQGSHFPGTKWSLTWLLSLIPTTQVLSHNIKVFCKDTKPKKCNCKKLTCKNTTTQVVSNNKVLKSPKLTLTDGSITEVSTGSPREVRYVMAVKDANDTSVYETQSGSKIIIGRAARARADLIARHHEQV